MDASIAASAMELSRSGVAQAAPPGDLTCVDEARDILVSKMLTERGRKFAAYLGYIKRCFLLYCVDEPALWCGELTPQLVHAYDALCRGDEFIWRCRKLFFGVCDLLRASGHPLLYEEHCEEWWDAARIEMDLVHLPRRPLEQSPG